MYMGAFLSSVGMVTVLRYIVLFILFSIVCLSLYPESEDE